MNDYDIQEALKRIEDELIASMMRNMQRHRAEETKEGIEWGMWQAEQLRALEEYRKRNAKKYKGHMVDQVTSGFLYCHRYLTFGFDIFYV